MSLLTLFASQRRAFGHRLTVAAAILTSVATLAIGGRAKGQSTDPPNKPLGTSPASTTAVSTEKQSPVNPFPFGGGDAQNRSWAALDMYWGVTDANYPDFRAPLSRLSDYNPDLMADGWTFPRLTDPYHVIGAPLSANNPNSLNHTVVAPLFAYAFSDGISQGTTFTAVTGLNLPSTGVNSPSSFGGNGYYEAGAVARPAANATTYDVTQKFVWRLDNPGATITTAGATITIPGAPGQQRTYRIFVHIPTPTTPTGTTPGGLPENRIDDARYTIYYYLLSGGIYYPRQQVCMASQINGTDYELKAMDGSTITVPLFSSATFTTPGMASVAAPGQTGQGTPNVTVPIVQGVAIDDTTSNATSPAFVLADSIMLEPNSDSVQATPTITPPHGGSFLTSTTGIGTTAAPVQTTTYLPDSPDPAYNNTANAPHQSDPYSVYNDTPLNTFSFINDAFDPRYGGAGYANYVPWNPSSIFAGPRSLIDARFSGTGADGKQYNGQQVGPIDPYLSDRPTVYQPLNPATPIVNQNLPVPARSSDATNNDTYRISPTVTVPYFSHYQVLLAKTSFVQDPENGVPDNQKTGVKTIAVSAVYALDWLTGAPVWRFPDRTYLPTGAVSNGKAIPEAGLRNPQSGFDITGAPVFTVPGIVAIDRNGDGQIEDDEVYIGASQNVVATDGKTYTVTTGNNTGGAINASVTLAPRVPVQGHVQVPVHDVNWTPARLTQTVPQSTDIYQVADAAPGRYYSNLNGSYAPVPVGMAFIAAGNGVLYAVDAYGNNDTRYFPGTAIGNSLADPYYGTSFGTYQAGTTNVFWTFSETNHAEQTTETHTTYYQRLAQEIPGTSSFGASAPVLAWNYTDAELAQATPPSDAGAAALRLFVGNTNGVLYAMDPNADAGFSAVLQPPGGGPPVPQGVRDLPFIKGAQVTQTSNADYYGTLGADATLLAHQADLTWWFRTVGSINYSPAVSPYRHDQTSFNNGPKAKGVYVSTAGGYVYAVDWAGPQFVGSGTTLTFDGTGAKAMALNDDIYDHQVIADEAANFVPDTQQGTVRPRWTFPNLYRSNTQATANKTADQVADMAISAQDYGGKILAEPSALGAVQNAPVLMDFWWKDPDVNGSTATLLDYVVVVANDPAPEGGTSIESRVYLLDQIGDRVNYLTNPRATSAATTGRAISQPRDKFSPKTLIANTDSTIPSGVAWTYRVVNEAYPANGATPQAQDAFATQLRNTPLFNNLVNGNPSADNYSFDPAVPITSATVAFTLFTNAAGNLNEYVHQPARRMVPTVFVGRYRPDLWTRHRSRNWSVYALASHRGGAISVHATGYRFVQWDPNALSWRPGRLRYPRHNRSGISGRSCLRRRPGLYWLLTLESGDTDHSCTAANAVVR